MRRPIEHVLTVLAAALVLTVTPTRAERAGGDVEAAVRGNAEFAFDLYGALRAGEGNLFISPHTVSAALAMTWLGARGETGIQMAAALRLPGAGSPGVGSARRARVAQAFAALKGTLDTDGSEGGHVLAEANALWGQRGHAFLESFQGLVRSGFGSELAGLDFASDTEGARRTINAWAEEKTNGKIRELVRPGDLDPEVRIVLANAVYFRGRWARRFEEAATREVVFHREPGRPERDVVAPMMFQTAEFAHARLEEDNARILELPYEGGRASMLVLLPDENAPGGLASLEERLNAERLDAWVDLMSGAKVAVGLPSFCVSWGTTDLVPALRSLGMTAPFGGSADFSGMDGTTEIYVNSVLHKAFVDVNEEGTEAAAATAVVGRIKASPPVVFRADRPFLFLIRDADSGSVLFIGRVMDPAA